MSTAGIQPESPFAFYDQFRVLTDGPNEDTGLFLEGE